MIELKIFTFQFLMVYALVFQSLCVNNGHVILAMLNSLGIGLLGVFMYRVMPNADMYQIVAYLLAGPLAVWCAMSTHPWVADLMRGDKLKRRVKQVCADVYSFSRAWYR